MRCTFCGHEFGDASECTDCGMPRASMSDDLSDFEDDLAFDDDDDAAANPSMGFKSDGEPIDQTLQNLDVQDIVAALASVDSSMAAQVAAGHGIQLPGQNKEAVNVEATAAVDDNSDLLDFDEDASAATEEDSAETRADDDAPAQEEAPFSLDGETPGVRLRVGRPSTVPSVSLPEGVAEEHTEGDDLAGDGDGLPQDDFSPPQEVFYEDGETGAQDDGQRFEMAAQPARGWGLVALILVLMAIVGGVVYMFLTVVRVDAEQKERRSQPGYERTIVPSQQTPAQRP